MTIRASLFTLLLPVVLHCGETDPRADPRAVVRCGNARFTLLTPGTIRMEWAADSMFEDRASLTFVNRRLVIPEFSATGTDSTVMISTNTATLLYRNDGQPFNPANTSISFTAGSMNGSWVPGQRDTANLLGTTRTLDGADGDRIARDSSHVRLEDGLLSRAGWTVIDDTGRPLFDPWVTSRPPGERRDMYFFAYGHDYRAALRDFISIGGKIPIPPRFVFGYWYSRWRSSTEMELRDLITTFRSLDIPLDVLLIDMDWHITALPEFFDGDVRKKDQAGQDYGWTGFTWNRDLFPDPPLFLRWMKKQGLQIGLNLHPASGIQPHEEQYPAMARAMGIDPASRTYVPFNIVDRLFAQAYFDTLLHPMEKQGVDFWWLDWQQWNTTSIPGVNPTFYLNHLHFTDMLQQGRKRPLIYHRWGGLGNHRYQIGFSGDTKISWASLAYQPYFTATASNVGFGYWGNDIGGFFGTPNSPELFTRWFQFGVFSPILKTHATGRDFTILRKLWEYPHETFLHLRDLVHLRYAFLPYIYSAAHTAHDSGVSICHPLYYDHPDNAEAYAFRNEYYFGPDIIVHPITHPIGADSIFTMQSTWLPPGIWFEWHTGTILRGDTVITRPFRVTDIPLYVRAGAIIPMAPRLSSTNAWAGDSLNLTIFPGEGSEAVLYGDEGNTTGYLHGRFSTTRIRTAREHGKVTIIIEPANGSYRGMPASRRITLRLPCSLPPTTVMVNNGSLRYAGDSPADGWSYDGLSLTTIVALPSLPVLRRTVVTLTIPEGTPSLLNGVAFKMQLLDGFTRFLSDRRNFRRQDQWSDARHPSDRIVRLAQTGLRITNNPHRTVHELRTFSSEWPVVIETIRRVAVDYPQFRQQDALLRSISGGDQ